MQFDQSCPSITHGDSLQWFMISSNVVMFRCRSDAEINTFLSGKIGPTVTILFYCITFSFNLHLFGMYFIEPYYIYLDCMYYNSFHRFPQRCVSRALVSQSDTLIAQCAKAWGMHIAHCTTEPIAHFCTVCTLCQYLRYLLSILVVELVGRTFKLAYLCKLIVWQRVYN